tara:strand:- start:216 stop:707 length:492 start_codon:yes stop_codon:yes gene_type:complete
MIYKGYVYKITCNESGLTYYGSTTQRVSQRLCTHRKEYKNYIEGKSLQYITAFEVLERDNYSYVPIEKFEHEDLETLKINIRLKERYYIDNYDCVNKLCPIRTRKEKQKFRKEYYKENLEEITKLKREKIHCDFCDAWICRDNISRHNKTVCHLVNKDIEILE